MVMLMHGESSTLKSAWNPSILSIWSTSVEMLATEMCPSQFSQQTLPLESDGDKGVCNLRACLTLQLAHLAM